MYRSELNGFGRLFDSLREFERLGRAFSRIAAPASGEFPAVNVWANSEIAVVTAELPGVDPKSIEISVADKTLRLKGSREPEEVSEGVSYHRKERWYGRFTRTIDLPFRAEAEKVSAHLSKGALSISLPRSESEKPRKIEIRSE